MIEGTPLASRCTVTSAFRPSSVVVPEVCGKERWIVHVTKNAAATATITTAATTRNAMRPMRAPKERRGGTADAGESVIIVENSFG